MLLIIKNPTLLCFSLSLRKELVMGIAVSGWAGTHRWRVQDGNTALRLLSRRLVAALLRATRWDCASITVLVMHGKSALTPSPAEVQGTGGIHHGVILLGWSEVQRAFLSFPGLNLNLTEEGARVRRRLSGGGSCKVSREESCREEKRRH